MNLLNTKKLFVRIINKLKGYDEQIGDTTMGTTATTLTGAIAEHEGDISTLNSKFSNIQSATAESNITIDRGGYIKIGKLVLVDISFTTKASISSASTKIAEGFPTNGQINTGLILTNNNGDVQSASTRIYGMSLYSGMAMSSGNKYRAYGFYFTS